MAPEARLLCRNQDFKNARWSQGLKKVIAGATKYQLPRTGQEC